MALQSSPIFKLPVELLLQISELLGPLSMQCWMLTCKHSINTLEVPVERYETSSGLRVKRPRPDHLLEFLAWIKPWVPSSLDLSTCRLKWVNSQSPMPPDSRCERWPTCEECQFHSSTQKVCPRHKRPRPSKCCRLPAFTWTSTRQTVDRRLKIL
jgi:hypothetical protein